MEIITCQKSFASTYTSPGCSYWVTEDREVKALFSPQSVVILLWQRLKVSGKWFHAWNKVVFNSSVRLTDGIQCFAVMDVFFFIFRVTLLFQHTAACSVSCDSFLSSIKYGIKLLVHFAGLPFKHLFTADAPERSQIESQKYRLAMEVSVFPSLLVGSSCLWFVPLESSVFLFLFPLAFCFLSSLVYEFFLDSPLSLTNACCSLVLKSSSSSSSG